MLDFTKDIKFEPSWQKKYLIARIFLYAFFFAGSLYFADKVLFPSVYFSFDFKNPAAKSNSIYNVTADGKMNFDIFSSENFSSAEVWIYFEDELAGKNFGEARIRKTYKAFSYPELNESLSPVNKEDKFPNSSLVSFDNAVFIIDGEQAFPFKDPQTFISMGYNWDDVVPASESELGLARSNILFAISQPHPNGTVFSTREDGKYYLISNGRKQEIANRETLKYYLKGSPVLADKKSLDFQNSCALRDTPIKLGNSYHCSALVDNLAHFLGNNYQFEIDGLPAGNPEKIEVEFSRKINWLNLRDSLSKIKKGILANLGYATK